MPKKLWIVLVCVLAGMLSGIWSMPHSEAQCTTGVCLPQGRVISSRVIRSAPVYSSSRVIHPRVTYHRATRYYPTVTREVTAYQGDHDRIVRQLDETLELFQQLQERLGAAATSGDAGARSVVSSAERAIVSVLGRNRCLSCHGSESAAESRGGGLHLARAGRLTGNAATSDIFAAMVSQSMPPSGPKVGAEDLRIFYDAARKLQSREKGTDDEPEPTPADPGARELPRPPTPQPDESV